MGRDGDVLLSEISPKDAVWRTHKIAADRIALLYRETEHHASYLRMLQCCQRMHFVQITNLSTGEIFLKLHATKFCRVPRCPSCQFAKMRKWIARSQSLTKKLFADHPEARYIFLTLTVKNCHVTDLDLTIKSMNSAWQRLSQLDVFPADGFLKTLEFTREYRCTHQHNHKSSDNKSSKRCSHCRPTDYIHPHFHCLLMVKESYFSGKNYLSQKKWTELWRKSLRVEYIPIVNVKRVKSLSSKNNGMYEAVRETLKYALKSDDLLSGVSTSGMSEQDFLIEITNQLIHKKLVSTGGLLKKYLSELEKDPEELIHFDDEQPLDDDQIKAANLEFEWYYYRHDFKLTTDSR
jgi:plasmid rolling circle replication initiator protein Rep